MHILSHFFRRSGTGLVLFFNAKPPLQNYKGNHPQRGRLIHDGGRVLQLSPFISETVPDRPHNYCGTLKESHNLADRFVSVRMTLSHLERRDAKGQTFLDDLRN